MATGSFTVSPSGIQIPYKVEEGVVNELPGTHQPCMANCSKMKYLMYCPKYSVTQQFQLTQLGGFQDPNEDFGSLLSGLQRLETLWSNRGYINKRHMAE